MLGFTKGELLDFHRVRPKEGGLIRGSMLREMLLSDAPHRAGCVPQFQIAGATIRGVLDLSFAKVDFPIRFESCRFEQDVILREAQLRSVSFRRSSARRVNAEHVRVTGDLCLDGMWLTEGLRLRGAHLMDDLHLSGTMIDPYAEQVLHEQGNGSDRQVLLDLDTAKVEGAIEADGLVVGGKVSMDSAVVTGPVRIKGATLGFPYREASNSDGLMAWCSDGLETGGDIDAQGLLAFGQLSFKDAKAKNLVLRDAQIITPRSLGLVLDRLQCDGSVYCDRDSDGGEGFWSFGGIHGIGTRIGAAFYFDGAAVSVSFSNSDGQRAVNLRRARIGTDVRCLEGFSAFGLFDIANAEIGGRALFDSASLRASDSQKIAFSGAGAKIGGDLTCQQEFECDGELALVNAEIGGEVTVANTSDEALYAPPGGTLCLIAEGLSVGRGVDLRILGSVNLNGARVTGDADIQLYNLSWADLSNLTADALMLRGWPARGEVDLTRASVRRLQDTWPIPKNCRLLLNGLEYVELEDGDIASSTVDQEKASEQARLTWLEVGTQDADALSPPRNFHRQPYQQLAATYRRAGDDKKARNVLLMMYRNNNRVMNRNLRRLHLYVWNIAQDVTVGYGFRAWPAILWLLGFVTLSSTWFLYWGHQRRNPMEAVILSLGLALPGSGYQSIEKYTGVGWGGHLVAALLILVGLTLGATTITALGRVFLYRQAE